MTSGMDNGRGTSAPPQEAEADQNGNGQAEPLRREDVYPPKAIVDGAERSGGAWTRLLDQVRSVFTSPAERDEAEVEGRLRSAGAVTRCNTIAVMSPKGGVGKTTCTFVLGNALSAHLKLRCVAIDADPDFGTLGRLARENGRSENSIAELLDSLESVESATELRSYVSELPSGLHILSAPAEAGRMAELGPDDYGTLTAFLGRFYDVVLLDMGTGIAGPLPQFAIERADQMLVVTTPDWVTARTVLEGLPELGDPDRATLVLNQAPRTGTAALEAELHRRDLGPWVTIPFDERLGTMLDTGTYALGALERTTRVPVKRLGIAAAELLV